jgi:hypothetical protein
LPGILETEFKMGGILYVHTQVPRRREMAMQSIAAGAGMTAEAIEVEMEQFSEALAPVCAKVEAEAAEGREVGD